MSKKEVIFWILFFLLNTLLFLPKFLLYFDSSTFFPDFIHAGNFREKWKFFFRRDNEDIFRISVDLLILAWIVVLFKSRKLPKPFWPLAVGIYFILFLYQIYQGVIQMLYHQKPLFYSDVLLIHEGLSILAASSVWLLVLFPLVIALLFYLVYLIFNRFKKISDHLNFSASSKIVLIAISIPCLMSLIDFYSRLDNLKMAFPLQAYWVFDNIRRSAVVYRSTHQLNPATYSSYYNYKNCSLTVKSNIYLFFIESYGRILYEDTSLKNSYLNNIKSNEAQLKAHDWKSVSAFSQSPVKGGRSWLAFTSFVTGTNIDKHALYDYLIDNAEFNLPTLYKSLKTFGYKSYWLSTLQNNRGDIPYGRYSQFYGINQWIRFDDLDYKGKLYGVLPAPADQYSLNFAHDFIRQQATEPFILFFISLNSHHPFDSPDRVVDNWRLLSLVNYSGQESTSKTKNKVDKNYLHSINSQLDYLTRFIIRNGKKNDLFILIGDHQPPVVANRSHSYDTPVHIISRAGNLIKNFDKYNFNEGMVVVDENERSLKHAGFHSMIMKELIHSYGTNCAGKLNYFPDGVQLNSQ